MRKGFNKGFSLIELLLVLAVATGVVALRSMSMVRFRRITGLTVLRISGEYQ
ncbi:prepilin-type N-terminal cleavage/methylation domain-containing protein [Serratia marcescens]|uniref:prepilin-type N-terminal cleavage/methylation domain-containing protein n=1 Tax=Serratia marcescens TaxID=615 RepID=UPI003C703830